jgi:hypothetical protein
LLSELNTMNSSVSERRVAQVRGAALTGPAATLIDVRATIDPTQHGFEIAGVPGHDTWTLRDRVRAAVLNSALTWPTAGIIVELSPGSRFRRGVGLDLAIAVAILAANGAIPSPAGVWPVFAAELGLDGQLRPVRRMVPVLTAATGVGNPVGAVISSGNQPDAATVPGVTAGAFADLQQVVAWLRDEFNPSGHSDPLAAGSPDPDRPEDRERIARAVLTYVSEPGDPLVTALLQHLPAAELVECIRSGASARRRHRCGRCFGGRGGTTGLPMAAGPGAAGGRAGRFGGHRNQVAVPGRSGLARKAGWPGP